MVIKNTEVHETEDILAEMDADVARAKQSSASKMFLSLQDGEKALIRPLVNLTQSVRLLKHEKYNPATNRLEPNAICAQSFKQECAWCGEAKVSGDKKLNASPRYYLPVYVHGIYTYDATQRKWMPVYAKDDITQLLCGVRVLEMKVSESSVVYTTLRMAYDDDPAHDIAAHDFAIARTGKKLDTKYTVNLLPNVRPLPSDIVAPERGKLISDIEVVFSMKTVDNALDIPMDEEGEEFP